MKAKITLYFAWLLLLGFLLAAANVSAQTIAYRQTNLASSILGDGRPFRAAIFIADSKTGRVTTLNAIGLGVSPVLSSSRIPLGPVSTVRAESLPI